MSDHEEKNVNQPDGEEFDFSSMSIDELIASTKEEIARIDEMMGTSRLPDAEEAAEELPQEDAPEAGEVSLDDGAQNPEEPKQQEPFEPKLPEEYADLSLDADEEPAGDDEAQRPRLAPGIKVLLYVCACWQRPFCWRLSAGSWQTMCWRSRSQTRRSLSRFPKTRQLRT